MDLNPIFSKSIWIDLGAGDGEFSFSGDVKARMLIDKSADNVQFLQAYSMQYFKGTGRGKGESAGNGTLRTGNGESETGKGESGSFNQLIQIQQCDLNNSEELKEVLKWGNYNISLGNSELKWCLKPEPQNHLIANSKRIFTLFSVLQYVNEPDRVLSDLHTIMSQNDLLILYLPVNQNQQFGLYKWMFQRFSNYESIQNRQHIFNTLDLLKLLAECGFEVVELQKLYGKWGIASHELNSMCFIAMSHSNFLIKLLGIGSYVLVWPTIQWLNLLERRLWNRNHDSLIHGTSVNRKQKLNSDLKTDNNTVIPIKLTIHNGLYVELKKR